jgi:RNA polymerase sigma-70 factor (ECF subfamily)
MIKGWINPANNPEKLLIEYVTTGNQKCLTLLVKQFNLPLYHYLLSLSNPVLAEDVLQSTWVKVMKNQSTTHTHVKNWLFTIARHTLIDELRYQNKWQYQDLGDNQITTMPLALQCEQENSLAQFNQAILQLPFYQREAFIFQQEGFTLMDISQLTNESFETVKSRLRYARNNLQKLLGKSDESR